MAISDRDDRELGRQQSLARYRIIDTDPEAVFDELVELAARVCQAPMAILGFIDADHQWFKASRGLALKETPRAIAFCDYTIRGTEPMVVADAWRDQRFADNPLVTDEPKLRFYAGVPLVTADGDAIGTIAVLDTRAREIEPEQLEMLQAIGRLAMERIEQRLEAITLQEKLAREQLRASEARFHSVLEHIPDVVVLYGPDLRIRYINPATTSVTGMAPEEFIGKRDDEIFPAEKHQPVLELLNRTLETRRSQSVHVDLELPNTGLRHLDLTCLPILDDQGQISEILGITRDLTRRRVSERKLAENRQLLEIAGRVARMGGWRIDLKSNRVSWDDEVAAIHDEPPGTSPDVEQGIAYFAPEYRQRIREVFKACAAEGVPYDEELQLVTARGRRVWVRTIGEPVRDNRGEIIAVQGAFQDISERMRAEEALRKSEERYRQLFDANPQPMWVFDLETLRFLAVNDAAVAHYGFSREQFLAMTIEEIRPPEDLPRLRASLAREMKPGYGDSGIWRHRKANGELIDVHISTHDIVLDGRPAELVLARDVTEQLKLEEQVRQSQRLDSIGQLTGGVAHDFNNLLTVILGNAEMLVEQLDEDSPQRHLAEMTRMAARRGADLTSRLLTFARRQTLEPEPTDIVAMTVSLFPLLRRSLPANIEIELKHADDLWLAQVDPAQLEGALLNLALNARDAMPGGGPLIIEASNVVLDQAYADAHVDVDPGEFVQIAVSDQGTGIAPQHMNRLFEPFFTTKAKGKGTGLGLPMVYGFVKQSGGHVRVYSEPGCGTTFRMYLPRAHEGLKSDVAPDDEWEQLTGVERVLVVEDDELVCEHAVRLLEQLGYRVTTAFSAAVALELLEAGERFDLLFTDVIIPGPMNGPALAHTAKGIDPDMRVLYTSGYTENAITDHGRLDSGVNLLEKPYHRIELARKVRAALDQRADHGKSEPET